ncbi:MAG: phage head-tail connector protein [Alphaproteobacteria bacterium]|nr:phage head-tail connector protein [Alphaproteobacteria bacterium]
MAAFKRVTPPAAEPVALEEVRAFLRIGHDGDDALIARLARAAREAVEERTGRALMAQAWRMAADWSEARRLNGWRAFALPRPPFLALTEVRIVRDDDTSTALALDALRVRSDSGDVLLPAQHAAYTGARSWRPVEIVWQAGHADAAAVPEALKIAVLMLTAEVWERRDSVAAPAAARPEAVAALLAPYRAVRL